MRLVESVSALAERIRTGKITATEAVNACLDRIESQDEGINAFVTVTADEARKAAREADRAVSSGEPLEPLHGVPIAIKDLYGHKSGVRNTYGSVPFADNIAEKDALVVERLEDAGAIIVGKTNTPEFGHKGLTDNNVCGPTSTPFDTDRNAGGSSGGSAAAVAAGFVPAAQGSDGGGSIRIPASFCGVYGLKPSFGRVPYEGRPDAFSAHTPFALAGPITRTVEDAALLLDVMCGPHERDPMSVPDDSRDYLASVDDSVDGRRIAYSSNLDIFPVDEEVSKLVEKAAYRFEETGATVEAVDVDFGYDRDELIENWLTVSRVKYATMAERLREDGVDLLGEHREHVAPELLSLIEDGSSISGIAYKRTDEARTAVFDTIQDIFERYDLLVTPTVAVPPVENGMFGPTEIAGESVDQWVGWFLTWPFNLTGHPAASVPAGRTDDGLPLGMQIVGPRYADDAVITASAEFERVQPWKDWYDDVDTNV
ncbi:amidase [Halobacteria archaeon AArc-curdl1]|uniref:Amidase n=1 Tax=Natronosalvus hydrolyticus TaxID=2979988 RepID=A0AAP2ZCJ0_9EURY|nr:amidase [Halobacteria archaeon AArc-curdl1]